MKKKEKEHLKADPFQNAVNQVIQFVQRHRRELLISLVALLVIFAGMLVLSLVNKAASSRESNVFTRALDITASQDMKTEDKAAALLELPIGGGLSNWAAIRAASLLIELGDYEGAGAALQKVSRRAPDLLQQKKKLLQAMIKSSLGDFKGGQDIIAVMLNNPKLDFPRDYLLLENARQLWKAGQSEDAVNTLRRISVDHPASPFNATANELLAQWEGSASAL